MNKEIVLVLIGCTLAVMLFFGVGWAFDEAVTLTEQTDEKLDSTIRQYKDYYKVGQHLNMTMGKYFNVKAFVNGFHEFMWYDKMVYAGVRGNTTGVIEIRHDYFGFDPNILWVNKGSTFISGYGTFKVEAITNSYAYVEVLSWSPSPKEWGVG